MKYSALACTILATLASANTDENAKFFGAQVLPILQSRCFDCHSNEKSIKGGLSLDTRAGWEIGGDHGPAVTPRNLKKSPLIRAIHHVDQDSAMPPKKKLSAIEIAMLETWVLMGAPDPRTSSPTPANQKAEQQRRDDGK